MTWRVHRMLLAGLVVALGFAASAWAAEPAARNLKRGQYNPSQKTVDMFDAIRDDKVTVKVVMKDDSEGKLIINNKTNEPLNVRLPQAFAAVPILAQLGGGMGGGGMGGGGMGGAGQQMGMGGGGMGGMGGGGMGGGGGGMFSVPPENVDGLGIVNVAAEKSSDIRLPAICLEHGKPDPRPSMNYEVRPIEAVTTKPGVAEIITLMASGQLERRSAQAAAWHLNNGLSWEKLAAKELKPLIGDPVPYFQPSELRIAMAASDYAVKEAAKRPAPVSPGEAAARETKAAEAKPAK